MIHKFLFFSAFFFLSLYANAQKDRYYIRKGNKEFRKKNYTKAEVNYRKSLSEKSFNSQALYNLGCALMAQQKDSLALINYNLAGNSEKNPRRKAMVYHNMGVLFQQRKMFDKAILAYKESLRNNPLDDETRYNLELCKRQLKKNSNNKNNSNNQEQNSKTENKNKENKSDKKKDNKQENEEKQHKSSQKEMTKDNAEQLLNAAMQQERNAQERIKKALQQPRSRQLEKNW